MAEDREQRISSALSSLIDKLIPPFEHEDDASFDERQLNALELARTILARCVLCNLLFRLPLHTPLIFALFLVLSRQQ